MVSRGYGAKIGPEPRVGQGAALAASAFGDEPALIARASGAPVSVHPKRALAAQALLRAHPDVDVIVSDDGLQHLALARDVEIVVQDERGIGNGRLLPAGPLREPASRLREVDAVVTNVGVPGPPEAAPAARPRQARMWLEPGDARQIEGGATRPLAAFAGRPGVAAAAGIGNPQRFFATLRGAGITPEPALALPDHHDYAQSPFRDWHAESILVTSKDAIKCAALHDARLWEVPVRARYSDPQLFEWLAQALRQLPAASAARRADRRSLQVGPSPSQKNAGLAAARAEYSSRPAGAPACRRRITASGRCTSTSSAASSSHAV